MDKTLIMQSMGHSAASCVQETRCVAPADLQLPERRPDSATTTTTTTTTPRQYLHELLEMDPDDDGPAVITRLLANAASRSPETADEVQELCLLVQDGAQLQSPGDFPSPSDDDWGEREDMYIDYEDVLSCSTEDTLLGDAAYSELTAEYRFPYCLDDGLPAADGQLSDMQHPLLGPHDTACRLEDATSALSIERGFENQLLLLSPTPSSMAPPPTDVPTPSAEATASPLVPCPPPPPPSPQKTSLIMLPPLLPMPTPPEQPNNSPEDVEPHGGSLDIEMSDEIAIMIAGYPTPPPPRTSISDDAGPAVRQPNRQPSSVMLPATGPIKKESKSKQRRRKPPEEHDFNDILRKVREALGSDARYASLEPEEQYGTAREASFLVENSLHQITAKLTRRRTVSYHTKKHAVSVIAHVLISVVMTQPPMALHVRRWCHGRDSSLLAALRAFSLAELDQFASDGFRELDALIHIGAGRIFPSLELIRDFVRDKGQARLPVGYGPKPTKTAVKSKVEGTAREKRIRKERVEKAEAAEAVKAAKKGKAKKAEKDLAVKKTRKRGAKKTDKGAVVTETAKAGAMDGVEEASAGE